MLVRKKTMSSRENGDCWAASLLPFQLPELEACESLCVPQDCAVIVAGGFEDRTTALLDLISEVEPGARALLIDYEPGDPANQLSRVIGRINNVLLAFDHEHDVIVFNRFYPDGFGKRLALRLMSGIKKVVIDISSMSKMALLLTLDVCREMDLEVSIFYAEAEFYGPSREDYEEAKRSAQIHQPSIQVYSGIGGVVRSARLSSVAMQGEPLAAMMFMSFNELLTQSLLNCVYPSRLFLINGRPPEHHWREEATAWIHERLRSEWQEEDNPLDSRKLPERSTSTLDYRETVLTLLQLYWRLSSDYRLVLAPTGSKLQTVGAFICRTIHPDIHIEYPTPKGYLTLYTSGVGKKWLVRYGRLGTAAEEWRRQDRSNALGIREVASSSQ
jgi:hypothetical protein